MKTWFALAAALAALGGWLQPASAQEQERESAAPEAADLFQQLDTDGDGFVSRAEVGEERRRYFDRLIRLGDADDDERLSQEEFTAALAPQERDRGVPGRPQGARPGRPAGDRPAFDPNQLFDRLDANGDGRITLDEVPEERRERARRLLEELGVEYGVTREQFAEVARRLAPQARPEQPGRPQFDFDAAQLFDRLDANGDGRLMLDELPEDRPGMRRIFERIDGGQDGITRDEFMRAVSQLQRGPGNAQPRPDGARPGADRPGPQVFRRLDVNNDGRLDREELNRVPDLFDELDADGDGFLTPPELLGPPPELLGPPRGGPFGPRPEGDPGRGEGRGGPPGARFDPDALFDRLDRDDDGRLTPEELPEFARNGFGQLDANDDGELSRDEFRNARPRGEPPRPDAPRLPQPAQAQPDEA